MTTDKAKLTGFSLKLSPDDKKRVKLICAASNLIDYQYELFDQAVKWAVENRDSLMPIANTKQGKHQSYYLCESLEELNTLVAHWDCNHTRALYTAVVGYLKLSDAASVA